MPLEPEMVIKHLEDLASHPGWEIINEMLTDEIAKAGAAVVIGKTVDEIAISAVNRATAVWNFTWVRDSLMKERIRFERGRMTARTKTAV